MIVITVPYDFCYNCLKREGIMANQYAEFYKCALQVNPYDYIKYRGEEHQFEEAKYNHAIFENCLKTGIKVVGLVEPR